MKITVPGCLTLTMPDRRWFVLRLKPGMDDTALGELAKAGYDVYLPRRRFDRHKRRQRVLAEWSEPLLPGYAFIVHPKKGDAIDDWTRVKRCNGVVAPLGNDRGPLLIPPPVIEIMMLAELGSTYDETKSARVMRGEGERQALARRFQIGKQFLIKDGPFASFLGEVEDLTHQDRVKMLVSIFGRLTSVDVDPEQLEEPPRPRKPKAA